MTRNLYTLVLVCALVLASLTVFADTTPSAPESSATPPVMISPASVPAPSVLTALRMISIQSYPVLESQLKLTDAQKPRVRDLLTKAEEKFKTLIEAQRKAGRAFVEALTAKTDETMLISLGQAAAKADADLIAEKVKTLDALRALLTDQQNMDLNKALDRIGIMWKIRSVPPSRPASPAPTVPTTAK